VIVDIAYKVIDVIEKKRKKIMASKLKAVCALTNSPLAQIGTKIAITATRPAF
jgi:hypothetical protein